MHSSFVASSPCSKVFKVYAEFSSYLHWVTVMVYLRTELVGREIVGKVGTRWVEGARQAVRCVNMEGMEGVGGKGVLRIDIN